LPSPTTNGPSCGRCSTSTRPSEGVTVATEAIADRTDLAAGTIKRFLYELADVGVIDWVQTAENSESGRPPSRLEPAFPPTVFRRLDEIGGESAAMTARESRSQH
jgi:hypothetical protein